MFRPMNAEMRIALMQAMEERQELGHELLGPDHLLLGLLSNVRGTAYQVLTEHGVTYEWARRVVADKHEDVSADDADDDPAQSADNLDEDREALRAIGIDLDKVRDAVRDTFGEDITQRWGQRRERGGPGRRRPRPEQDHDGPRWKRPEHDHDGPRHGPDFGPFAEGFPGFGPGGRGRRGPRSRRFSKVSPSMRQVMHELHLTLHSAHPGDANQRLATGVLLAAVFNSGDPATEAVIAASDDPKALRAAVEELAGHATA